VKCWERVASTNQEPYITNGHDGEHSRYFCYSIYAEGYRANSEWRRKDFLENVPESMILK
jgi:hypothetical protein